MYFNHKFSLKKIDPCDHFAASWVTIPPGCKPPHLGFVCVTLLAPPPAQAYPGTDTNMFVYQNPHRSKANPSGHNTNPNGPNPNPNARSWKRVRFVKFVLGPTLAMSTSICFCTFSSRGVINTNVVSGGIWALST